ncbi:MAG: VWA domain-containing protein [Candidatus Paceibacterota bacterium]
MKKYFLLLTLSFLVCLPLWARAVTVSGVDILNDNGGGTYFIGNVSGLDPKKYYDAVVSLRYPAQNPVFSVGLGGRGDVVNNKFKVFIKDVNLTPTLRPNYKIEVAIREDYCPIRNEKQCCYFSADRRKSALIFYTDNACKDPARIAGQSVGGAKNFSGLSEAKTYLNSIFAGKNFSPLQCVAQGTKKKLAIAMAIDNSGSMAFDNKLSLAKLTFLDVVDFGSKLISSQDKIAIEGISFDTKTTILSPTGDLAKVSTAINGLKAQGDTALFDAAKRAIYQVARQNGYQKVVILFTDGNENSSLICKKGSFYFCANRSQMISVAKQIAALAKANNTRVYTIGLGVIPKAGEAPKMAWYTDPRSKKSFLTPISIDGEVMSSLSLGSGGAFYNIKKIDELFERIRDILQKEAGAPNAYADCAITPTVPKRFVEKQPEFYLPKTQVTATCRNIDPCTFEICETGSCFDKVPDELSNAKLASRECAGWQSHYSIFNGLTVTKNDNTAEIKWNNSINRTDVAMPWVVNKEIGEAEQKRCFTLKAQSAFTGAAEKSEGQPYLNLYLPNGEVALPSPIEFDDQCFSESGCANQKPSISLKCFDSKFEQCATKVEASLEITCNANLGKECKDFTAIVELPEYVYWEIGSLAYFGDQKLEAKNVSFDATSRKLKFFVPYSLPEKASQVLKYSLQFAKPTIMGNNTTTMAATLAMDKLSAGFGRDKACYALNEFNCRQGVLAPEVEIKKSVTPFADCSNKAKVSVEIKCKDPAGKACDGVSISDYFFAFNENDLAYKTSLARVYKKLPARYIPGTLKGIPERIDHEINYWEAMNGGSLKYLQLNLLDKTFLDGQTISYEYDVAFDMPGDDIPVNQDKSQVMFGGRAYSLYQTSSFSNQDCQTCEPKIKRTITPVKCKNEYDIEVAVSCFGPGQTLIKQVYDVLRSDVEIVGPPVYPPVGNSQVTTINQGNTATGFVNVKISAKTPYKFNYKVKFKEPAALERPIINDLASKAIFTSPKDGRDYFIEKDSLSMGENSKFSAGTCLQMSVPIECKTQASQPLDIAVVVDTSGTMVNNGSLCNANRSIGQFLNSLSLYNQKTNLYSASLVYFCNLSYMASQLSNNIPQVQISIDRGMNEIFGNQTDCSKITSADYKGTYQSNTNICSGLKAAYNTLQSSRNNKLVILLSDGASNTTCDGLHNPAQALEDAYGRIIWLTDVLKAKVVVIKYNVPTSERVTADEFFERIQAMMRENNKEILVLEAADTDGSSLVQKLLEAKRYADVGGECQDAKLLGYHPAEFFGFSADPYALKTITYPARGFEVILGKTYKSGEADKVNIQYQSSLPKLQAIDVYKKYLEAFPFQFKFNDSFRQPQTQTIQNSSVNFAIK